MSKQSIQTSIKTPAVIAVAMFAFLGLMACAGGNDGLNGNKKAATADGTGFAMVRALGDNCKEGGLATTIAGFDARIALVLQNAPPQLYSLGFVGQVPNFRLNEREAILAQPAQGAFSVQVILRNIKDCEAARENGSTAACQLNFGPAEAVESFDVSQKLSFVVSGTVNDYIQGGALGSGQDGIVANVVNGEGLIGFLSKMGILKNLGGGGGALGNLSNMVGISDQANQQLAYARAQESKPKAGCSVEAQGGAQIGAQ